MASDRNLTQPIRSSGTSPERTPVWNRVVRSAAPAVMGYVAVRLIGLCCLWIWATAEHESMSVLLGNSYDSVWYLQIADHGYDHGESAQSNMVFFPLYPMLTRAVAVVSPLGTTGTALLLAWTAGIAAAWGMYHLGNHLHDRRTGIVLAILWGALPHAVVESMAYTESPFTALAVWSLYAVLTKRWLTAGLLCLLAGLSRPTAAALIAVVCLAALVSVVRRPSDWRAWTAIVIAPAGWIGYIAWVGHRVHRLDGWFHIEEEGWKTGWDGGRYTLDFAITVLTERSYLALHAVTLVLVVALMLMAHSILQRQPWPLLVYSAALLIMTIGSSGMYHAKARFLLVAFPLLLPVACALAKTRTSGAVVTVSTLTLISAYFGGYLLLVWQWSP